MWIPQVFFKVVLFFDHLKLKSKIVIWKTKEHFYLLHVWNNRELLTFP